MIGTAEAIIFPFLPTRCIFLSFFSNLCILESQQYSLVTNKTHRYAHTDRHIYCTFALSNTGRHSSLVRFHSGVQRWQPHLSGVCAYECVCARMCVSLSVGRGYTSACWFWCIELLPICHIQLQFWSADAHSLPLCVCAGVCRSPPAVLCWREEPQVSACDLTGLVLFSSHSGIIQLLLF